VSATVSTGVAAVEAVDGVVRARVGGDRRQHVAGEGVDDVPAVALERRQVDDLAVRGERHPVAALLVGLFPEDPLGHEVEAGERLGRADVEPLRAGAGADSLDVVGLALLIEPGRGDALDELVAVVDVEDQQPVPAIFGVVADPRHRHVEPPLFPIRGRRRAGERAQEDREEGQNHGDPPEAVGRCVHAVSLVGWSEPGGRVRL
jgi:hypothetical protein